MTHIVSQIKYKYKTKESITIPIPTTIIPGNIIYNSIPDFKFGQKYHGTWSTYLRKGYSNNLHNFHKKQENCDSENYIQLYVNDPNYLYQLYLIFPFVCKIGEQTGCGPTLLHEVCKERGWKEFQSNSNNCQKTSNSSTGWNLWWQCGKTSICTNRYFYSWQMTNFMDHKYNFTDKDVCSRFLTRLQKSYGSGFDFGPMSFNLPNDYPRLCSEHSKRTNNKEFIRPVRSNSAGSHYRQYFKEKHLPEKPIWICKPVGKSRGRGITVFDTVTKIGYHTQSVVQEYISRPYLIGGYKWDLRIYVCIVSTNPLIIYAYREGIVRFATDQFTLKNLYNPFAHLTNTSLNKGSPSYRQPKEVIGVGCKWTIQKLRKYWIDNNVKDWYLWQRILKILILTIIGDADNITSMSNSSKSFSLFGFDIMVDSSMKPYLLEVNKNPALGHDCDVDIIVKKPMLHDLFDLLGLPNIQHFESGTDKSLSGEKASDKCLYSLPLPPMILNSQTMIGRYNIIENGCLDSGRHFALELSTKKSKRFEPITKQTEISWCKAPLYGPKKHNENELQFENQNNIDQFHIAKNPYFSISGAPGDRRIDPPLLVKIPNIEKKVKQKTKYEIEGYGGMILGVRNWEETTIPPAVGDWSRIFPFDICTDCISRSGTDLDIRRVMNHMNDYLRVAKDIFISQITNHDLNCDLALQKLQNLNVPVWHPYHSIKIPNINKNS